MTNFHKLFMVKINEMIIKKTGTSFLVFYVIYGSLVCIDSKKTVSCLLPRLPASYHLCNFKKVIKMQTCTHTGQLVSVPLCPRQSELTCICLFLSNLIINLIHNIIK